MAHGTISKVGLIAAVLASAAAGEGLSPVGAAQAGVERPAKQPVGFHLLLAAVRVIRKTTIYVATLPQNCVRTEISNTVLWRCGKTYYEADGTRYVVVYVE